MKVTAEKDAGQKDIDLQIYTGDRARDLQKLEKYSINPVFAVFFAQAVNTFQSARRRRPGELPAEAAFLTAG